MDQRREERFGPVGAALIRSVIPLGLVGLQVLLLPAGLATRQLWIFLVLIPVLLLGVLWCAVRNFALSRKWAKVVAGATGIPMVGFSALWSAACVVGAGGI